MRPNSQTSRPSSRLRSSSRASLRPPSRVSQRPTSRQSHRPPSRHAQLVGGLVHDLVANTTGLLLEDDPDAFTEISDFAIKTIESGRHSGEFLDLRQLDLKLAGLVEKARINLQNSLAEALRASYGRLKDAAAQDKDPEAQVKTSNLPEMFRFLLALSEPPQESTHNIAFKLLYEIKNPPVEPVLTWKSILAEDPLTGQHWKGAYGLPPGAWIRDEEDDGDNSSETPSLSSLDISIEFDDASEVEESRDEDAEPVLTTSAQSPATDEQTRILFDGVLAVQYWKSWKTDSQLSRPFNSADSSTFGPAIDRATRLPASRSQKYIDEADAVRECLMGLTGRRNFLLEHSPPDETDFVKVQVSANAPRPVHLSASSYHSVLSNFAVVSSSYLSLRAFVQSSSSCHCRTLEAFAEAINANLMTFEKWCAEKEEIICRAKGGDSPQQIVASLLSLDKDVKAIVDCTFEVLLEVIKEVRLVAKQALNRHDDTEALDFSSLHPSILSTTVLDSLASAIQTVLSTNPSISSATALGSVFSSTAAPLWSSLLRWLKDGASMLDQEESFTEEDSEFFIRRRVEVSVSSPEFWVWGYSVRTRSVEEDDTEGSGVVPAFLGGVVKDIMAAGKAVGLLRALGVEDFFRDEDGVRWLEDYWIGIENLVHNGGAATNESHVQPSEDAAQPPHSKFDVPPTYSLLSTENFDLLTTDYLAPICRSAQLRLNRIFTEDLRMWDHLQCIEDLYLMRKGDVCGHFCDILFGKMDQRQAWNDFHFLNSAFRDVVDASPSSWIDSSLVQLSFRGARDQSATRSVRVFQALAVEYQVPFPLTYLFGPSTLRVYSSVFVFLLQIRRAKSVVDNILLRGVSGSGDDLKGFYVLRTKLSWFLTTLLSFVVTHVLQAMVSQLHEGLRTANSLDDMILVHDAHLRRIQMFCFLHPDMTAQHRATISILDMCLRFSDALLAWHGDEVTHDISRQSFVRKTRKQRRTRRARQLHQKDVDVIGFGAVPTVAALSSDESSSDEDEEAESLAAANDSNWRNETFASLSLADEPFASRIEIMTSELDVLVRFLRRSVENMGNGGEEGSATFSILAFMLDNWDNY